MTLLTVMLALLAETVMSRLPFQALAGSLSRLSEEWVVDFSALGLARWSWLQWWLPVMVWVGGALLIEGLLQGEFSFLFHVFGFLVLVVSLRLSALVQLLTQLQLYLNQSNELKAAETLSAWMRGFGVLPPELKSNEEVVVCAIDHATERLLRQFFSVLFWFVAVPGAVGLVFYLSVWWTVWRERQMNLVQPEPLERVPLYSLLKKDGIRTLLSARFVLYSLEWFPARLYAVCLLAGLSWSDALEAWRQAANESPMSNRARLVALIHCGLNFQDHEVKPIERLAHYRRWLSQVVLMWLVGLLVFMLVWS